MVNDNQPTWNKPDESIDRLAASQSYTPTTGTSTGVRVVTEENQPTTMSQSNASSVGTGMKGMNPTLARLLVGGLVGATLGTLAGALTGKKATNGFNHAAQGVGQALKTIGGGLSLTARGVGDAVKSVGEGVGQAVVGTTSDVVEGTTESLKPVVQGTLNAVKDTADNVKQSAASATDALKNAVSDTAENAKQSAVSATDAVKNAVNDTAENTKQSAVGAADAVKDTAEDAKQSVAGTSQVTTGQSSNMQYAQPQTTDIIIPREKERLIIDQDMDVEPGAADFTEGQAADMEISTDTTDSEFKYGM